MNGNNKKLNLLATISILVSGMIGSAIFSLSGLTVSYAGPSSILSWILAAVIQLFYGLSMAELATTYKKSGGVFVFPENTFEGKKGECIGFVSTWGNLMADIVSIAFSSMYIGIYLSASFPILSNYQIPISVFSIFIIFFLNTINFSTTGKINMMLASILAIILIAFSILCISSGHFDITKFTPFFTQGVKGSTGFLQAVPIAMIGYSSIMSVSFMVQDVENPSTNIKKAVYIGMFITVIIYVFSIFATVGMISTEELIANDMIYIPFFAVCFTKLTQYPFVKIFISIAAVIALLTTMLVVMAVNGRCMKAVADKKLLPTFLSKLGKNNTPIYAMFLLSICSIVFSFFPSITEVLVNLGALFAIMTKVINLLSLYVTRNKKRVGEFCAPISNLGIIFIMLIFAICYIPDIAGGGYKIWIFTLLWYLMGFIVYRFFRR